MLTVSDIMTESVVTLTTGTPIREAATTLANMGVSGAPVCDTEGRLLGVLSKSDITSKLGDGAATEACTVDDLMTSLVFSVRPGDPLKTAIWLMVYENVHRLMVTDDDAQIVGIVTPMDVCKAIVSGKLQAPGLAASSKED